jgi:hypothetical protein
MLPGKTEGQPMSDESDPPLVPGRECGGCDVCCVHMTIDVPELHKPLGTRCHNLLADNRCRIYESRPDVCRRFFCGWRTFKWVKPGLRPDTSGVLVTVTTADDGHITGAMFTLLRPDALDSEGLAESVAAIVASGAEVRVRIPGPPGPTLAIVRVEKVLRPAVRSRDKAGVLYWLRKAWDEGRTPRPEEIELSAPASAPTTPG